MTFGNVYALLTTLCVLCGCLSGQLAVAQAAVPVVTNVVPVGNREPERLTMAQPVIRRGMSPEEEEQLIREEMANMAEKIKVYEKSQKELKNVLTEVVKNVSDTNATLQSAIKEHEEKMEALEAAKKATVVALEKKEAAERALEEAKARKTPGGETAVAGAGVVPSTTGVQSGEQGNQQTVEAATTALETAKRELTAAQSEELSKEREVNATAERVKVAEGAAGEAELTLKETQAYLHVVEVALNSSKYSISRVRVDEDLRRTSVDSKSRSFFGIRFSNDALRPTLKCTSALVVLAVVSILC